MNKANKRFARLLHAGIENDVNIRNLVIYLFTIIFQNIKNIFVLREMLAWKPVKEQTSKDNYDNLISLGLAIMASERAEMLGIVQDDSYNNSIEGLINRKNNT